MKRLKLTKMIASVLVVASVLSLNPIGVSAEWKQDSNGWWNTEGSSWSIGWKQIDGKWYYFNYNGYMAKDTTVDGYKLGSDGAWIQDMQNNSSNVKNSYKELDELPKEYNADDAQKDGDVVQVYGIQYNIEKLDKFIDNYKNKKANVGDMVRITGYGDEGGAIIRDLIVEKDCIKFVEDNTRDPFSSEKDKVVKEYKVVDVYKKSSNVVFYYAKTDTGEEKFLYCADVH
ncbi:MAG: DUF4362 domain-containing protein [Clostridium beijerinckii]|nr:DUF4362 domain-containing protein [Clostridium beijerinckii]